MSLQFIIRPTIILVVCYIAVAVITIAIGVAIVSAVDDIMV